MEKIIIGKVPTISCIILDFFFFGDILIAGDVCKVKTQLNKKREDSKNRLWPRGRCDQIMTDGKRCHYDLVFYQLIDGFFIIIISVFLFWELTIKDWNCKWNRAWTRSSHLFSSLVFFHSNSPFLSFVIMVFLIKENEAQHFYRHFLTELPLDLIW